MLFLGLAFTRFVVFVAIFELVGYIDLAFAWWSVLDRVVALVCGEAVMALHSRPQLAQAVERRDRLACPPVRCLLLRRAQSRLQPWACLQKGGVRGKPGVEATSHVIACGRRAPLRRVAVAQRV